MVNLNSNIYMCGAFCAPLVPATPAIRGVAISTKRLTFRSAVVPSVIPRRHAPARMLEPQSETPVSELSDENPQLTTVSTSTKLPVSDFDSEPAQTVGENAVEATGPGAEAESVDEAGEQDQGPMRYSMRARLREETEAPFRKARMFVYGGSAVSAGVGGLIAFVRIIASLAGVSGTQPLSETIPNLGIDLAVIAACAALLRFETAAGEKRLKRMSRGAALARLRVQDVATGATSSLKDRRGSTRVVIVAGRGRAVRAAVNGAEKVREEFDQLGVEVVPYVQQGDDEGQGVTDGTADEETLARRGWRSLPVGREEWSSWLESEMGALRGKMRQAAKEGGVVVLIVRLDGKVGARSVGPPLWEKLVEEVRRLPNKDQYGRP